MNQAQVASTGIAPVMSHKDVMGTGVTLHVYGAGFAWNSGDYLNFSNAAEKLQPYMETHRLHDALVPDFRGMNARMVEPDDDRLTTIYGPTPYRLRKTNAAVDGIRLRKKLPVFAITADCPTVLLADVVRKKGFVLHSGRDSLQPYNKDLSCRVGEASIIHAAMRALMPTNPQFIRAFIACGIGADSYDVSSTHGVDGPFYRRVIEYFRNTCGPAAAPGEPGHERLDLIQIIRAQLAEWGVIEQRGPLVGWDRVDTHIDARFHSRRRPKDTGCNCVLVEHPFE